MIMHLSMRESISVSLNHPPFVGRPRPQRTFEGIPNGLPTDFEHHNSIIKWQDFKDVSKCHNTYRTSESSS